MRLFIALTLITGSSAFLLWKFTTKETIPKLPQPPPVLERNEPMSYLPSADGLRVKNSALRDPDPQVRMAAIQLLFTIKDPELVPILENMVALDTDTQARLQAITLLKNRGDLVVIGAIIKGLSDTDKSVRSASLKALGDIGDPSATPWILDLLNDSEPEVKMAALRTLGRFQEKRVKEFRDISAKLRKDYEATLARAKKKL